jgi:arylsulfatase A-like enzyme
MPNDRDTTYSRREFLRVLGAGALAAALPNVALGTDANEAKKPNVLMLVVDDLRPQLGCYGHKETLSPNIDRFAGSATLFERGYCNVPICMASRVGALTGVRANPGAQTVADLKRPELITLPALLKKNGYHCVSNGKVFHHMPDSAGDWSEPPWRSEEIYHGKHDWAGYDYYGIWQNPESAKHVNPNTKRGPFCEEADVPDDAYQDGKVAAKTITDLKRLAKGSEPFFLAAGFWRPHLPFNAPKKYWDLYDAEKIAIAGNRYPPKNLPDKCKPSGEIKGYAEVAGRLSDVDFHREARHAYYACVSYVDAQIGKVLDELDRLNLAEDTIVILFADHGWHLGEHDFWGKHNTLNNALQVPLIIRAPGRRGGHRATALVEWADIYPTLCDLADVKPPSYVEGKSLAPLLSDPKKAHKEAVYARWEDGRSVKTDRYLYTEWPNGEQMLYDHQKDPQENVNIAGDPKMAGVVAKHQKLLNAAFLRLA